LAHPERYPYFSDDLQQYDRLNDIGYKLQVNLLSFTGYYGKDAAKAAQYIVKNDLASYLGTDMHHFKHLEALSDPRNKMIFHDVLSYKKWNTLLD
jgi:tyrosine-protein phosphatase YwqE